jgi:hypothetical protein
MSNGRMDGRTSDIGIPCMSRSNLRIPKPIHFKLCRVVEYDGLTICILCGEISIFHSRVMGLPSLDGRMQIKNNLPPS